MRNQKQEIAFFEMLESHAELGFHIMYICIKGDHANKHGHESAAEELEKCGELSLVYVDQIFIRFSSSPVTLLW